MFGFGKKISKDEHVYAPVTGEVIPLDKVSDPVFAQKMMGDGYAVEPNASKIVSPVSGKVTMVQGHAVGLKRFDDLELLVHIGIDTVSLNGKPFTTAVKEGDIVDAGDDLVTVNWEQVEEAGLPKTTLVLITNTADKLESITVHYGPAVAGQQLGSAKARRD